MFVIPVTSNRQESDLNNEFFGIPAFAEMTGGGREWRVAEDGGEFILVK